jgi:hypothetical protein
LLHLLLWLLQEEEPGSLPASCSCFGVPLLTIQRLQSNAVMWEESPRMFCEQHVPRKHCIAPVRHDDSCSCRLANKAALHCCQAQQHICGVCTHQVWCIACSCVFQDHTIVAWGHRALPIPAFESHIAANTGAVGRPW